MSLPEAALFDFDGTLVQITIDFQAMRQGAVDVVHRYGQSSEGDSRFTLEMVESVRDRLASTDPQLAERFQQEALASIRNVELAAAEHAAPLPGVIDTLEWLRMHGVKVGIVTRNCRPAVLSVAERHHLHFDALVTRDDVKHVKPHPEHLLQGLRELNATPARSIMVGDHPTDVQAARAAGMVSVGVTTTRRPEDFDVVPSFVIENMEALMDIVGNGAWELEANRMVEP